MFVRYLLVSPDESWFVPYEGTGCDYRIKKYSYGSNVSNSSSGGISTFIDSSSRSIGPLGCAGVIIGPVLLQYASGKTQWISIGICLSV